MHDDGAFDCCFKKIKNDWGILIYVHFQQNITCLPQDPQQEEYMCVVLVRIQHSCSIYTAIPYLVRLHILNV